MTVKKTAIITLALIIFGWAFYSIYKISATTAPDFSVLWLIAKDFGHVDNPYLNPGIYTPSGYPPFSYLFYIPLTLFPFNFGLLIFLLISFSAILGSVWISIKLIFKKVDIYHFLFASALTLIAFPTKFSLGMGQVNSIVLFLLLFSYMQTLNKKEVFPGILMGVAVMLKPIFAFFLLFFLIQEKWRLIFYSIITVLTGFAVTYAFYGLGIWEYWINDIIFPLLNYAGREVYYNQGFLGFASRFIASIEIRKIIEYIILPVSLIPIFIFRRTKSADLLLSLFILTLLITDSISWQHHFVWLIFPFILLTYYSIKLKGIWFWIFLGISYLLVSWNFKNPLTVPVILLSNTFYGGAILYFLNIYLLKLNLNHHG